MSFLQLSLPLIICRFLLPHIVGGSADPERRGHFVKPHLRILSFPQFRGDRDTQLPPSVELPLEADSRESSGRAAIYEIRRGIQRFSIA
jgi:hypothetical protein